MRWAGIGETPGLTMHTVVPNNAHIKVVVVWTLGLTVHTVVAVVVVVIEIPGLTIYTVVPNNLHSSGGSIRDPGPSTERASRTAAPFASGGSSCNTCHIRNQPTSTANTGYVC